MRWQVRIFREWFSNGRVPDVVDLPTGLGKTSVMPIWYLSWRAGAKGGHDLRSAAFLLDRSDDDHHEPDDQTDDCSLKHRPHFTIFCG